MKDGNPMTRKRGDEEGSGQGRTKGGGWEDCGSYERYRRLKLYSAAGMGVSDDVYGKSGDSAI